MRLSLLDANAFSYVVYCDGWPQTWGKMVFEADDEARYVCVVVRSEDGGVIAAQEGDEGARWVDGRWVVVERRRANVEFRPVAVVHPAIRERNALWHGRVDKALGRSHWGRAAYPYAYDLQDSYDAGWSAGPP